MRKVKAIREISYKEHIECSCDKCGKLLYDTDSNYEKCNGQRLHIFASYGQNIAHQGDTDIFNEEFDICDECVMEALNDVSIGKAKGRGEELAAILRQLAKLAALRKPWERK